MADKEKELLCSVWRKANAAKAGITIPCATQAEAARVRFALYNAVKFARRPGATVDNELAEAIENCSVSLKEDRVTLVVGRKWETGTMGRVMAALAAAPATPLEVAAAADIDALLPKVLTEDKALQESAARLYQKLAAEGLVDPALPPPTNPYYQRD